MSEVNWREEAPSWSCESEGSGEILDEEMVSDSYQVFSKLFRHYRRKLRAVTLGKGRCNNWVPIIVAIMNWRKHLFHNENSSPPHFQLFFFNDRLEFCEFFEWKIKRITMQIYFHSRLCSYLPRVAISGGYCSYYYFYYYYYYLIQFHKINSIKLLNEEAA